MPNQLIFNMFPKNLDNYLGTIYTVVCIIATIFILVGLFYVLKRKNYANGKWLLLTGSLLLINPIIYLLTN